MGWKTQPALHALGHPVHTYCEVTLQKAPPPEAAQ